MGRDEVDRSGNVFSRQAGLSSPRPQPRSVMQLPGDRQRIWDDQRTHAFGLQSTRTEVRNAPCLETYWKDACAVWFVKANSTPF